MQVLAQLAGPEVQQHGGLVGTCGCTLTSPFHRDCASSFLLFIAIVKSILLQYNVLVPSNLVRIIYFDHSSYNNHTEPDLTTSTTSIDQLVRDCENSRTPFKNSLFMANVSCFSWQVCICARCTLCTACAYVCIAVSLHIQAPIALCT